MQKALIVSRIGLALLVIVYAGYIVNQYIPFTGIHAISYTFDRPDGAVGIFRPSVRYELIDGRGRNKAAKIIEDPVYFDIKTIKPYRLARFEFVYQKHTSYPVGFSHKTVRSGGKFKTVPFHEIKEGDWTIGWVDVDLLEVPRENNRYTFAFSVPGLVAQHSGGYVVLSKMDVRLVRKSLLQTVRDHL